MTQKDHASIPIRGSGPPHSEGYLAEVLEILFLVSKVCGISREGGTRSELLAPGEIAADLKVLYVYCMRWGC